MAERECKSGKWAYRDEEGATAEKEDGRIMGWREDTQTIERNKWRSS